MTTTVKIRDEDKEKLDRIKAKLVLRGVKLNQEELLGKIIDLAESSPLLLDKVEFSGVSEHRKKEILSYAFSLGTSQEETIDHELYR